MTNYQSLKFLFLILIIIGAAINASASVTPLPSPSPSPSPNQPDSVVVTSPTTGPIANSSSRPGDGTQPLITDSFADAAKNGVAENAKQTAAIVSDITAMYNKIEEALELEKARASIDALKVAMSKIDLDIKLLLQEIEKLERTEEEEQNRISKSENENKDVLNNLKQLAVKLKLIHDKVASFMQTEPETKIAVAWLKRISQDSAYATKLLTTARSNINNTSAFSQFLKNDIKGTPIDVREIKDSNGLMFVVRIGKLTHCLSTKLQCGGKRYSVTK